MTGRITTEQVVEKVKEEEGLDDTEWETLDDETKGMLFRDHIDDLVSREERMNIAGDSVDDVVQRDANYDISERSGIPMHIVEESIDNQVREDLLYDVDFPTRDQRRKTEDALASDIKEAAKDEASEFGVYECKGIGYIVETDRESAEDEVERRADEMRIECTKVS